MAAGRGGGQESYERRPSEEPEWEPEVWVEVDVRREAEGAVGRASVTEPGDVPVAEVDEAELVEVVGSGQAKRMRKRLEDAARSFSRGHFEAARRMLRSLSEEAPKASAVRELHGLTLYRLGRWRAAARELEAFRQLTGSTEQHPVLADCYRALGRYGTVERLWDELRRASPGAEAVTEGRIVSAGALADQGELSAAIDRLGSGWQVPKRPREHHLRRAYALADLCERAGDLPRAREIFSRLCRADPAFADVELRLRHLR